MKYSKEEIEKADEQYKAYLSDHIKNVQKAFQWLVDKKVISGDIEKLKENIKNHDKSKYSSFEWDDYRNYFNLNGDKDKFNYAWLHHIHNNPHHWQYWVLVNDDGNVGDDGKMVALKMSRFYVVEMICDWWAFSWKKGNLSEIFKWYEDYKKGMKMHEETIKDVEELLNKIKEKLSNDDSKMS